VKPSELKKHLVAEGFQVFRTLGSQVLLAERVRDNLVMDSGIAVMCGSALSLRVTFKAHARDFPKEGEDALFERARELGAAGLDGYDEVEKAVIPISDPGMPESQIDACYEVTFERREVPLEDLAGLLTALLQGKRSA
jgi:hypothetical protein